MVDDLANNAEAERRGVGTSRLTLEANTQAAYGVHAAKNMTIIACLCSSFCRSTVTSSVIPSNFD